MKHLRDKITVNKPQTEEEHDAAQNSLLAILLEQAGDAVDMAWLDDGDKRTYHGQVVVMSSQEMARIMESVDVISHKMDSISHKMDNALKIASKMREYPLTPEQCFYGHETGKQSKKWQDENSNRL